VITIDVDFDGTVLWNGEIMPDRATIETRLTEAADEGVVILQDTPSTWPAKPSERHRSRRRTSRSINTPPFDAARRKETPAPSRVAEVLGASNRSRGYSRMRKPT
jgi:hypothetical protein